MWIAQDRDGWIKKHYVYPRKGYHSWLSSGCEYVGLHSKNAHWDLSVIDLEKYDYVILQGELMIADEKKATPRKHGELAAKYWLDNTVKIQILDGDIWEDVEYPMFNAQYDYREKPKTKRIKFRNYLDMDGVVRVAFNEKSSMNWLGDWNEVEVEI